MHPLVEPVDRMPEMVRIAGWAVLGCVVVGVLLLAAFVIWKWRNDG
jgi:hypothetical protein